MYVSCRNQIPESLSLASDQDYAQSKPCTMKTPRGPLLLLILTVLAPTTLFALAVPPTSDLSPTHHPLNLTSTPPSSNSQAHCFTPTSPFTRRKPRFSDCGAAIRRTYIPEPLSILRYPNPRLLNNVWDQILLLPHPSHHSNPPPPPLSNQTTTNTAKPCLELPSNHIIGIFHTTGPPDQFSLPLQKTSGSCSVEVRIQSGFSKETSTWLAIGAAASQLNMACVSSFGFPVRVGGWTEAGSGERITVLLHYSGGGV